MDDDEVQICGAGPAGLSAAITLARAGRRVVVHEAQREVGYRFKGDLQGLENWSSGHDVLGALRGLGLTAKFANFPCTRGVGFDAWGRRYEIAGKRPLFYLVERGPGPQTLDTALLNQARSLGAEVRFKSRLDRVAGPAILATGPKTADGIAVGYHFDTDLDDGFHVIYDNDLAPKGYAYLLVMNGHGTVKSCMFTDFKREQHYVELTVERFRKLVGLEMKNPRPHGGAGNFRIPDKAVTGKHPVAGEQAGFQDFLWGFGMRFAMVSGVLAARSLLEGKDYDKLWRSEFGASLWSGQVNRAIFGLMGNRGYRWLLRRSHERRWDAHRLLWGIYYPWAVKRLLTPWARMQIRMRRKDLSCDHLKCDCVWCRHGESPRDAASKSCDGLRDH